MRLAEWLSKGVVMTTFFFICNFAMAQQAKVDSICSEVKTEMSTYEQQRAVEFDSLMLHQENIDYRLLDGDSLVRYKSLRRCYAKRQRMSEYDLFMGSRGQCAGQMSRMSDEEIDRILKEIKQKQEADSLKNGGNKH